MFFLNLTAGEFFGLLAALGGIITALYLLDRTKRKKVVSTLRFWTPALRAEEQQHRKRMRDPWSLLLQLLSLVLLLLAIAQTEWGSRERHGRNDIILLDTSSWTAEQSGQGSLLDREKIAVRRYLARLPARDRVMLVRADALATPLTPFTPDRTVVLNALSAAAPAYSALNMRQALAFAREAKDWSGGYNGEVVYVGPELVGQEDANRQAVTNLRVLPIPADRENCGIKRLGVRRGDEDPDSWEAAITLKNYGFSRKTVRLQMQFAQTPFASRTFVLGAQQEIGAEYKFTTRTAGQLTARLEPGDALAADDTVSLELPGSARLRVAVFSNRPDVLRPLLEANHRLFVKYFAPSAYAPRPQADVMILDEISPASKPEIASLWTMPDPEASPLPVTAMVSNAVVKSWHPETALASGLHEKEMRLASSEVFQTFEGDLPVASVDKGPVVVARPGSAGRPRLAEIGFDPFNGDLRFEVTTPLLFANLLQWLAPESFRELDGLADHVGAATIALNPQEAAAHLRVTDQQGFAVPFTVRAQTLQLFTPRPSVVRVVSNNRERVLSLTLPDVAEIEWHPPQTAKSGLPPVTRTAAALDLWKWFAVLGAICLFVEWVLFGRERFRALRRRTIARQAEPNRELVLK
ncbi:MAG TPA: BatA and WFA domain-containing protein [Bryobacteraceae bacterium]|jgi:hypothetical protein|nr:BatA and WFA domain-containing protein [Bryobacteraceae bacterium]